MTITVVINNYIISIVIFILLMLIFSMFYYFRKTYSDSSFKDNGANNGNNADISPSNNHQQDATTFDSTHNALLQLVEEPESTEPFILFLNEIEKLTNATSSALFITPEDTSQLTLLTCTDINNNQDWSEVFLARILSKVTAVNKTDQILEILEEKVQPEYKFICIRLYRGSQDTSLLVLKLALNIKISDSINTTLMGHANRLAKIISSVRLARLKLRQTQHEERAVIARELHDSLAQSLSYLKIQTSRLQSILTNSDIQAYSKSMEIDAMMQDLRSNLNIAYHYLRELISTFRLTMGGGNFSQALTERSGIAFDIDNRLPTDILSVTEEIQLLHIIRESFSNVVRYSQAKISLQ